MKGSIKIFLCYAHEDDELRQGLVKQLRVLQRQGFIDIWHDRRITAGNEWVREIDIHLNSADIILLLISPDFMTSDYCYGIEMQRAMERHMRGEARVIPIILRHVHWQSAPFGKLQVLPTDTKPMIDPSWSPIDRAFFDVAEGIREVAEILLLKRRFEEAYKADDNEAILTAYDNIQRSSYRESFDFSLGDLRRIDLALRERQIGSQGQALSQNEKTKGPNVRFRLRLFAADKSDIGKQREQNEDCAYKRVESSDEGDLGLFVVADGMGGYNAGEVASKLAIGMIRDVLDNFFQPLSEQHTIKLEDLKRKILGSEQQASSIEQQLTLAIEQRLTLAIQHANKLILRYGQQQPTARGLGCKITAALILNGLIHIANVGDCRTYLLQNKELKPLTKDHSLVAKLVESKQITEEEVYTHPQRHLIYRLLGAGHMSDDVDIYHEVFYPGDKLLLCSRGLWGMVHHQDLLAILSEDTSPQATCNKLIERANENGGEENITAIVVHINTH